MRKEKKNVSMLYIANWFEFGFIIMIAISMFFKSTLAGVLMLICAVICSPFVSKKMLKSGKASKSLLFISHIFLFLILWGLAIAVSKPKEGPVQEYQQIIAEETTAEATEQPTEPPTETEPETIPETTEGRTEESTEAITEIETEVTTEPETEAETEPPTEPKPLIGKDIDTIDTFHYNGAVRNDVTGNWRCAVFAESGINVAEYAVSYYDKYMSGSDTEIDAVINLSDKTTTKIVQAIAPEKLALTVYQYVQGEEHDAKLMFSGQVLAYYMVNKETGEITEE